MKPANGLTRARRELTKFWLQYKWPATGAIVLLVLALGLHFGLAQYNAWVSEQNSARLEAAGSAYGQGFAGALNARLAEAEAAFDVPALSKILAYEDPEALEPNLVAAVEKVGFILAARYVEAGAAEVDRRSQPPLGYAALDMLQRTEETGAPVPPEALFFGSEDQQISMLYPLRDGGSILGHVLVALDVSILQAALDVVGEPAEIYIEIGQPVPKGKPLRLAQAGDTDFRQGIASMGREISGTRWRMSLWQPQAAAQSGGITSYVWGGLGGLALLIVAGGGFVFARQRKSGSNKSVLSGAAAEVMVGEKADDQLLARFDSPESLPAASAGAPPLPDEDDGLSGLIVEETEDSVFDGLDAAVEPPPVPPGLPSSPPPVPDALGPKNGAGTGSAASMPPASVFRAYDIRGVVNEGFGAEQFRNLGRAIGSEAYDRGQQTIVVGRDGRLSSPQLHEAIVGGLRDTGRDVIDIGLVPTPVLYFATYYLNTGSGVMSTLR